MWRGRPFQHVTTTQPLAASDGSQTRLLRIASAACILACLPFFVGGALVIRTEVPPSLSPTLGMLSHALWALGIAILTVGVVSLVRAVAALRTGLAGLLSVGVLGLGVLHALQWVSWAYVDVRGNREGERDLVLDTIVVPFGAGHLLVYGLLLATGIGLLGWALRRATITHRYVGWTGIVLGAITACLTVTSLLFAFGGGDDGHALFDIATLFLPVLYLWAMVLGVDIYRRT